ncbi:fatty acid desaturase [Thioclava sp. FR2]|uniref:fatty acid desaturase n=1 Tax=Thioclava sp. FR2 TaxID=3445780 RepID=UPI003EBFD93C
MTYAKTENGHPAVEWPTLALLGATYLIWVVATSYGYGYSPVLATLVTGVAIAQFSSLQHEVLHGHPFRNRLLNEMLVFPGLTLTVPYGRFRDTHLAHHHDPNLTDPYDDPESNFVDPVVWARLPKVYQAILRANNTLLGRVTIGPLLGNILWLKSEARLLLSGNMPVIRDWLLHLAGVCLVLIWLSAAGMSVWAYLIAAYIGHGLLKIRTFLEHRAHEAARARTVIVEDHGPLSWLFLNNNLHSVHHCHPNIAWYRLPKVYEAQKAHYQARNAGYVYRSYPQIFKSYLLRTKDPVPHPMMPVNRKEETQGCCDLLDKAS